MRHVTSGRCSPLQVCDFNLSRVMEESVVLSSMVASNPRWLAPEILAGLPYTVAADVYSFGVIMWELLTWEVPWHQQNTWQVQLGPTSVASIPSQTYTLPCSYQYGVAVPTALMKTKSTARFQSGAPQSCGSDGKTGWIVCIRCMRWSQDRSTCAQMCQQTSL